MANTKNNRRTLKNKGTSILKKIYFRLLEIRKTDYDNYGVSLREYLVIEDYYKELFGVKNMDKQSEEWKAEWRRKNG